MTNAMPAADCAAVYKQAALLSTRDGGRKGHFVWENAGQDAPYFMLNHRGQNLTVVDVHTPFCSDCNKNVVATLVRSAGAWVCTDCGLQLFSVIEGDGLTGCPPVFVDAAEEEEELNQGRESVRKRKAGDLEAESRRLQRTAQRHKLLDEEDSAPALVEAVQHLARSHGHSLAVSDACARLAVQWQARLRQLGRRVGRFSVEAAVILTRVLFEAKRPLTRNELAAGAVGCTSKALSRYVRELSQQLQLQPPYHPRYLQAHFVARFIEQLLPNAEHTEAAQTFQRAFAVGALAVPATRPEYLAAAALVVSAPPEVAGARVQLSKSPWLARCAAHVGLKPAALLELARKLRRAADQASPPPPPAAACV